MILHKQSKASGTAGAEPNLQSAGCICPKQVRKGLRLSCARPSGDAQCIHSRQPALAVPELPQAPDPAGQAAGEVPVDMLIGLSQCAKTAESAQRVAAIISAAVQSGACSAAGNCSV